jgi:glutamate racemase
MVDNQVAREALKHYLNGFKNEDTVLLGCTHFPVFKSLLTDLLPKGVTLVDSAHATASALENLLVKQHLMNETSRTTVHYLVTDSIKRFQSVGKIFLGEHLPLEAIELVDA